MRWWVVFVVVGVVVTLIGEGESYGEERRERRRILLEKRERRRQEKEREKEQGEEENALNPQNTRPNNNRIHIFYYGWFGSPPTNQEYMHWDHEVSSFSFLFFSFLFFYFLFQTLLADSRR